MKADMETFYDTLGISRDATPDEIRAAYRALVKQYHPDVNHDPDAGERFIAIQQAYETLIDPDARARYDLALRSGAGFAQQDPFTCRPGGQTAWTPGFSWQGQMPGSGLGRAGMIPLLFFGAILIVLTLALSLLLRAVTGGRRQDS